MSRYSLKPLPEHSDILEVAVGWDPGLDTFFVQVFGAPETYGEPEVRLWGGTTFREIPTVDVLLAIAEEFVEIPAVLRAQLEQDRTAEPFDKMRPVDRIVAKILDYATLSR